MHLPFFFRFPIPNTINPHEQREGTQFAEVESILYSVRPHHTNDITEMEQRGATPTYGNCHQWKNLMFLINQVITTMTSSAWRMSSFFFLLHHGFMGLEKLFLLKRICTFSKISQFLLLFVVICKWKKLFLGLIGEYFNFSAINSESWLSQPSFNQFLAESVFKVVLDIGLNRERYSAYTTQLSPAWLYRYFEPCYGAEHCIRKKPMVLGFSYGCEVRVCI